MKLLSAAFTHGGKIPAIYTCDGKNISPPLTITDIPPKAKSLVLIMDDPDVPKTIRPDGMCDHWIIFNIPTNTRELLEGKNPQGILGTNTRGGLSYGGPCPPDREHRYFFKLYALDTFLKLQEGATKKDVEEAMDNHIIAKTELIGLYERRR